MDRIRAKITLDTTKSVLDFVSHMTTAMESDRLMLENFDGTHRVSARSFLGAMYASTEWGGEIYLINETNDGVFPSFINDFRV